MLETNQLQVFDVIRAWIEEKIAKSGYERPYGVVHVIAAASIPFHHDVTNDTKITKPFCTGFLRALRALRDFVIHRRENVAKQLSCFGGLAISEIVSGRCRAPAATSSRLAPS